MVASKELRARAREQLGGGIFQENWLMTLVAVFIFTALTTVSTYTGIVLLIIVGPLQYGLARLLINNVRKGGKVNIGDLFVGFSEDFSNTLVLGILKSLFTALWTLLFVIPGIIKSYSYSMAEFIQQDSEDKNWKTCLDKSRAMMDGYKWKLFCLDLSFIGWYIVGSLCLGIGVLFVHPYHEQARANFYEELCGAKVEAQPQIEEN